MLLVFPPIVVAEIKIFYGCNFVAPLKSLQNGVADFNGDLLTNVNNLCCVCNKAHQ